ncbi:hypothetical protein M569_05496, partial [Genlisea aurea]
KGNGGDYSFASSAIDDNRAPGVVARLMGLDCLPKSSIPESHSTPIFDSQSLRDSHYRAARNVETRNEFHQKATMNSSRPMEKFQTEVLPPKSAKSIPVTSHKLLSPIKSTSFIPPEDAAHIMDAAARIIKPLSQGTTKSKLPLPGSSLAPLRLKDLKEKVDMSPKPPHRKAFDVSQNRRAESSYLDSLKELSFYGSGKSLKIFRDLTEQPPVSLSVRTKVGVQRKDNNVVVSPKDGFEFLSGSTTKTLYNHRRGSGILRQNNQKQNRIVIAKGKLPSKCNSKKEGRTVASKVGSQKQVDSRDDKREESRSVSRRANHRKRNSHDMVVERSCSVLGDSGSWGGGGSDVVSFTFNAPMKRSMHYSSNKSTREDGGGGLFSTCQHRKRAFLQSEDNLFNPSLLQVVPKDALSNLLEQKLKEFSQNAESSATSSVSVNSSLRQHGIVDMVDNNQELNAVVISSDAARKPLDCRFPSPVSVLERSSLGETCNSDTADSSSTGKKGTTDAFFSMILLDTHSSKASSSPPVVDADLSDSASSTSVADAAVDKRKRGSSGISVETQKVAVVVVVVPWEHDYVKEMVRDAGFGYQDFASGRTRNVVSPGLFARLESQKWNPAESGIAPRIDRRILFDCAAESLEARFKRFFRGGRRSWAEGVYALGEGGKERLAGEIYREISGRPRQARGEDDSMVDRLVDDDMSRRNNPHGKWL